MVLGLAAIMKTWENKSINDKACLKLYAILSDISYCLHVKLEL
jgi:hypothetical protein